MKKILPIFCLITICLFFVQLAIAQQKYNKHIADSERFSAGVLIGYNNSQIDGDYQIGFDKYGITGGIRGIARITSRLDFNIEMLYSKKGAKIFSEGHQLLANPKKNRIIDLTYVDAPIFFKFLLNDLPSTWHIEAGGIYSRLTKTDITETVPDPNLDFSYEEIVTDFDKDDMSVLLGFGHTWKNGFSLNGRYSISVKKFYINEAYESPAGFGLPTLEEVQFLRNYHFSLSVSYTIFQRELKNSKRKR